MDFSQVRHEAFSYYFYFMEERMAMFWKKYNGQNHLTSDKILAENKFTNVYRASDRVSQYLIKNVIYNDHSYNELDTLFRILIFKIFNKVETWEFIERQLGTITISTFNVERISGLLDTRIQNQPIFSAAYMMTGSHNKYETHGSKHQKWLSMVDLELVKGGVLKKIITAKSLESVYKLLLECSFIGEFLAYQYAIDFNYSEVLNFDEDSFVKAGIGAIRGIKKCFKGIDDRSFEKYIRYTQENIEIFREKYGYIGFKTLFGRQPKLIDLQNCFCETDKYLRAKMPELNLGNTRIKQKYVPSKLDMAFFFPHKWGINQFINECGPKNSTGLTLF